MAGNKSKTKATEQPTATKTKESNNQWMPITKHLGAYIFLLIVAMVYFKPVAFDGKALVHAKNEQAVLMQTEMLQHQVHHHNKPRWTNQCFGGMPTHVLAPAESNYCHEYLLTPLRLFQSYHAWGMLFLILLTAYIGLSLLGLDTVTAVGLSLILGFSTSNTLLILEGDIGKITALAFIPMMLGSLFFAYKRHLLLGMSLFALSLSLSLAQNHIQLTYYLFFALFIMAIFLVINAAKKQELPKAGKFIGATVVAILLALASNLESVWSNYEFTPHSARGYSELTKKEYTEGLPKDYLFELSLEKMETMTLLFPNFYGATYNKFFYLNEGTASNKAAYDPSVQQEIMAVAQKNEWDGKQFLNQVIGQYTRQYRGSQTSTMGPIYYGAVVCLLLILSLLLLQGVVKWGIISSFLVLVLLSWGMHFAALNEFLYNSFPWFNKFRDTKLALVAAQPLIILTIGLGLKEFIQFKSDNYKDTLSAKLLPALKQTASQQGYVILSGVIALAICAFAFLYANTFTLSAPTDAALLQISPKLLAAIETDRAALIQADVFRSAGFIIAALIPLFLYAKGSLKMPWAILPIVILACLDLGLVNADYISEESYVENDYQTRAFNANKTNANKAIEADQTYYRVADYSNKAPSKNAQTSAFHKSVGGGDFMDMPMLYQEFWHGYGMDQTSIALKQRGSIFNMLNVKYFIMDTGHNTDNPSALGHAWFVSEIKETNDANEALEALNGFAPQTTAVVQKKNATPLQGLKNTEAPSDRIYLQSYHPDTMVYVSETVHERFAVFSEMYYPIGWSVYIDDQPADDFIKTNYILRGMRVPAGKHVIKMIFEPQSVIWGARIAPIASLLILIGCVFFIFQYVQTTRSDNSIV